MIQKINVLVILKQLLIVLKKNSAVNIFKTEYKNKNNLNLYFLFLKLTICIEALRKLPIFNKPIL